MQRKVVHINDYQYIVEHYPNEGNVQNFIMLRQFDISNDIISDRNIYFIEKELYKSYIEDISVQEDELSDKIVFPIPSSNLSTYSASYSAFNPNYINNSLYSKDNGNLEFGNEVYRLYEPIYDETTKKYGYREKEVKCDKIRIYRPANTNWLQAIVCIENIINGIHFYYLCGHMSKYTISSESEFRINNVIYSEYIEVEIPNLSNLFDKIPNYELDSRYDNIDNKDFYHTYYIEDLNLTISTKNSNYINRIVKIVDGELSDNFERYDNNDDHLQLVPLSLLIKPFRIVEEEYIDDDDISGTQVVMKHNVKLYLNNVNVVNMNYHGNTFNVNIFPNKDLDTITHYYMMSEDLSPVSVTINKEYMMSLRSNFGFTNGIFSVLTTFDFPDKENIDDIIVKEEAYNYQKNQSISDKVKKIAGINEINDTLSYLLDDVIKNDLKIELQEDDKEVLENYCSNVYPNDINSIYNILSQTKLIYDTANGVDSSIKKAYELYNNVNEDIYNYFWVFFLLDMYFSSDNKLMIWLTSFAKSKNTFINYIHNFIPQPLYNDFLSYIDIVNCGDEYNEQTIDAYIKAVSYYIEENGYLGEPTDERISKIGQVTKDANGDIIYNMNDEYTSRLREYLIYNKLIDCLSSIDPNIYDSHWDWLSDFIFEDKAIDGTKLKTNILNDGELEEELELPIDFVGFRITIATDPLFKQVIYDLHKQIQFKNLNDFAFQLNNIFDNWNQLPNDLIVKVEFIDNILGKHQTSNPLIITKEWFKYMINNLGIYALKTLQNQNWNNTLQENMRILDLNNNDGNVNINFIDKLNCIIKKEDDNKISGKFGEKTKLLYKPIFYKVNDLQNIRLRSNLTQNIGINLIEYMTKVESFKLNIAGLEYVEYGRNDIYVIFKVDASQINVTTGKYDITNQDNEYISSGEYMLI